MDLSTCKSIINTLYFRKTVKKKSSNFQSNKMSNKQSKTLECSKCVSISSNICLCSSANIYKSLTPFDYVTSDRMVCPPGGALQLPC